MLDQDYIRTARGKRLPARLVYVRHALPNTLTATLTLAGLLLGGLIAGTVLVENIFAWPGLGTTLVKSVSQKDYPTVQAVALVFGAVVLLDQLRRRHRARLRSTRARRSSSRERPPLRRAGSAWLSGHPSGSLRRCGLAAIHRARDHRARRSGRTPRRISTSLQPRRERVARTRSAPTRSAATSSIACSSRRGCRSRSPSWPAVSGRRSASRSGRCPRSSAAASAGCDRLHQPRGRVPHAAARDLRRRGHRRRRARRGGRHRSRQSRRTSRA